jgi:hypothetical protein
MSRRKSFVIALPTSLAVAALIAPMRASALAQYTLLGDDSLGILAPCAGLLTLALFLAVARLRPAVMQRALISSRFVAPAALLLGGVIALAAPNLIVQLVGSLVLGVGAGLLVVASQSTFAIIIGFAIGPVLGMITATIGWRIQFAVSIAAAIAAVVFTRGHTDSSPTAALQEENLIDVSGVSSRLSRPANIIACASACALTLGFITWARYDEIMRPATVASQTAVVLTIGSLLGVWRGRALDRRGVGRRAVRHGMWCVLVAGLSTAFVFDALPAAVRALEPMLLAFGLAKMMSASARSVAPLACGSAVASLASSLFSATSNMVSTTLADLASTQPESGALIGRLRHASNSLPLAMNMTRDFRTGIFASPLRAAVSAQIGSQLTTAHLACVGLAVVCYLVSFVIPRNRTIVSRAGTPATVNQHVLSTGTSGTP